MALASQSVSQSIKWWHKFHYNCTCCTTLGHWANRPHISISLNLLYCYVKICLRAVCVHVHWNGLAFDCLIEHKVITKMECTNGMACIGWVWKFGKWIYMFFPLNSKTHVNHSFIIERNISFVYFLPPSRNFSLHSRHAARALLTWFAVCWPLVQLLSKANNFYIKCTKVNSYDCFCVVWNIASAFIMKLESFGAITIHRNLLFSFDATKQIASHFCWN